MDKVKSLGELKEMAEDLRKAGKRIVFTNGCFDLLHLGHVRYLEAAKKLGDVLIVGLNSDKSVKALKGNKRPVMGVEERAGILVALECVDWVVVFDELTPVRLIEELKPDVHVKGGDYGVDELPEAAVVKGYGGEVVIVPEVKGYSSSGLVSKILEKFK